MQPSAASITTEEKFQIEFLIQCDPQEGRVLDELIEVGIFCL